MSDSSESSSVNGEWEQMGEGSTNEPLKDRDESCNELMQKAAVMEEEMRKVGEDNMKMGEKMKQQEEESRMELREKDEEVMKLKRAMQELSKENSRLKSQIEGKVASFTLDKWMEEEINQMRLSNGELNEKIMEVYKKIWEKGVCKTQTITASERKRLTEEIQKLEDICGKISNNVMEINEESIEEITKHLALPTQTVETTRVTEKSKPVDAFLGKFVPEVPDGCLYIEIRKIERTELYELLWPYANGSAAGKRTFIPNNVEKNGVLAWVDGNVLNVKEGGTHDVFQLCPRGFKLRGKLYVRE